MFPQRCIGRHWERRRRRKIFNLEFTFWLEKNIKKIVSYYDCVSECSPDETGDFELVVLR